jgi:hypothetical protein
VLWLGKERCEVTWEPAENVPANIIAEFEGGTKSLVKESIVVSGAGQTSCTLTFDEKAVPSSTQHSRVVIKGNKGCVDMLVTNFVHCFFLLGHLLVNQILEAHSATLKKINKDFINAQQVLVVDAPRDLTPHVQNIH